MSVRSSFLESASVARSVIAHPTVSAAWESASALQEMTVGALAAHLSRSVTTVTGYLSQPAAWGFDDLLDAPAYYLSIDGLSGTDGPDLASELHQAIRRRAVDDSEGGAGAVLARWDAAVEELSARLATEPPTRVLGVLGERTMLLDDYLVTRLVELIVHTDDLSVSVGTTTPDFPAAAYRRVIDCLTEVAVRRHGSLAAIRAMTRVERDEVRALRVL